VATLVERRSTMLVKVRGKDARTVEGTLRRRVRTLPRELRRTLTWDRGLELALHKWTQKHCEDLGGAPSFLARRRRATRNIAGS
jgi:IS30 family transposase